MKKRTLVFVPPTVNPQEIYIINLPPPCICDFYNMLTSIAAFHYIFFTSSCAHSHLEEALQVKKHWRNEKLRVSYLWVSLEHDICHFLKLKQMFVLSPLDHTIGTCGAIGNTMGTTPKPPPTRPPPTSMGKVGIGVL